MKNYIYDAETNLFYPVALKPEYVAAGSWPTNGIEIEDILFNKYSGPQPEGKIRGADSQGMPVWVDIPKLPPPTADELAAKARSYRDAFIIATDPMMVSDYSIDDIPLTEAQRSELTTTRATYRAWPTVDSWPLIELPEIPQWLLIEAVNQGYRVPVWPQEVQ